MIGDCVLCQGMNFYCAIVGGYMMPIIHGVPIYLPPRGPPFIMMCIMGSYEIRTSHYFDIRDALHLLHRFDCTFAQAYVDWLGYIAESMDGRRCRFGRGEGR